MRLFACLLGLLLWLAAACASAPPSPTPPASPASRTTWILEPNEAYDALCFLNLLSGDPFYVERGYADEVAPWIAKLAPPARDAIARLRTSLKAANQIVPAYLALVMSSSDPRTLADLRRLVDDDAAWRDMRRRFDATVYRDTDGFAAMTAVRADLAIALAALDAAGFPAYWRDHALPKVNAAIAAQGPAARRYDVIAADEELLGRRLDTDRLTVYVLAYVRPHGIRITGWRFLSDSQVPLRITVKTALHELLHPPFARTGAIDELLKRIEADPWFARLVRDHDPAFGYTTAAGLLEEDLITAIDVYNAHRLGLLDDPHAYFADHDDGLHALAYLLFQLIGREHRAGETYQDFLLRLDREGKLRPGALEAQFAAAPRSYDIAVFRKTARAP